MYFSGEENRGPRFIRSRIIQHCIRLIPTRWKALRELRGEAKFKDLRFQFPSLFSPIKMAGKR